MQLSQKMLYFEWTGSGAKYIDIARCLSLVNRRLERQQGLYTVLGAKFQTNATGEFQISHAPTTWVTRNALVMAYEHWRNQTKRAIKAGAGSKVPRWHDFKVWLNNGHKTGTELTPRDGGPVGTNAGVSTADTEWVKAKLVIMDTDHAHATDQMDMIEPELHILGDNVGSSNFGIIHNYSLSRAYPAPATPDHQAAGQLSIFHRASEAIDETIVEIIDHLELDNDYPPYDFNDYPGGNSNFINPVAGAYVSIGPGDVQTSRNLNGFSAPNGLLQLQTTSSDGTHSLMLFIGNRSSY